MTIGPETSEIRRRKKKYDRNDSSKIYRPAGQLSLPGGLNNYVYCTKWNAAVFHTSLYENFNELVSQFDCSTRFLSILKKHVVSNEASSTSVLYVVRDYCRVVGVDAGSKARPG